MMNKIIMPTILAATILVVGMFALVPVDTAGTIHFTLLQGIFGSSVEITKTVNDKVGGSTTEFHQFILTSSEPFTIHDITVKGNLNTTFSSDWINVEVKAYPQEYGDGAGSAGDADDDDRIHDVLDDTGGESNRVVEGTDSEIPQTWSFQRADSDEGVGERWYGPNQNIIVEVEFCACSGNDVEFNAMVTFYLRGVLGDDVVVEVHEDTDSI